MWNALPDRTRANSRRTSISDCAATEHAYLHSRAAANHLERLAAKGRLLPDQSLELVGWSRTPSDRSPGRETFEISYCS